MRSCRGVSVVSVVSVSFLFACPGFSVHTVSDCGLGGKSPPQLSSPRGDSVHYSRTRSCSDLTERRSQEVPSLALSPWTFSPVMFTGVSSDEFLSLILLRDSAPSSEFLHRLVQNSHNLYESSHT